MVTLIFEGEVMERSQRHSKPSVKSRESDKTDAMIGSDLDDEDDQQFSDVEAHNPGLVFYQ